MKFLFDDLELWEQNIITSLIRKSVRHDRSGTQSCISIQYLIDLNGFNDDRAEWFKKYLANLTQVRIERGDEYISIDNVGFTGTGVGEVSLYVKNVFFESRKDPVKI